MSVQRLIGTSPLISVSDLDKSLSFYRETLGFEVAFINDDMRFAQIRREGAQLSLRETSDSDALDATAQQTAAIVWIEDVDRVYNDNQESLNALPEGQMRPPFDRTYGVREMHVKDPDGFLMFFTSDTAEQSRRH